MKQKRKNSDNGGLIGRMQQAHEERRRRSNKILLGFLGACGVLFTGMVILGGILVAIEREAVIDSYGEQIAGLCREVPMGAANLDNAPNTDGPSQLLLLRSGTMQRHPWHQELPISWRAETGDEVAIVGCIETDVVDIEVCEYERNNSGSTSDEFSFTVSIDREQTTVTVTLLNPDTGERIAERSMTGSEPEPCPPYSDELNSSMRLEGSQPVADDFSKWLEDFVDDTASS